MTPFYAVIPAGGAGTRLWPLSRAGAPKFLADITGSGCSMLQQTVLRLAPVATGGFIVVTGESHIDAVQAQLPQLGAESFVIEPSGRDSMAAIGLAAAVLYRRHGDVVFGSFAADHVIRDESAFHSAVRSAITAAEAGYIVTIGITPEGPATGFGYIQRGNQLALADANTPVFEVQSFLEKPDVQTAQAYVQAGTYLWNAGMFVSRTQTLLAALKRYQPDLSAGLTQIAAAWDTPDRDAVVAQLWPTLRKIAIDHAIAEPHAAVGGMAVVPVEMGWSDVGDYKSLHELLGEHSSEQVAPGGVQQPVVLHQSAAATVFTHSKPVVILGVDNAVVVETDDVIFVSTTQAAQQVKDVVVELPPTLANLR